MQPDPYQFTPGQNGQWPTLERLRPKLAPPDALQIKPELNDTPGVNGEARPSLSPLDFTPWTDIASAGVEGAGRLASDEAGALKLPWKNLQEVTAGANPLDMSRKDWGQKLQNLGPNIRDKNSQTIGAQLMDEFKSSDPHTLLVNRLRTMGLGEANLPSLSVGPMDDNLAGYYRPSDNGIYLNETQAAKNVQHPDADFLGTLGHEAQHAADMWQQPSFRSTPEFLPSRPFTNDRLVGASLANPKRVEAYLNAANGDPQLWRTLPEYVRNAIQQGYSPKELSSFLGQSEDFQNDMAAAYRQAVGNGGFRGNNRSAADLITSAGHFAPPIGGEMDLAPHHMAIAEANAGASEDSIHPDWTSQRLRKAFENAKAPQVQVPQQIPQPQAASPYAIGAGLAGGAGVMAGQQTSDPQPQPQTQYEQGQIPNPQPNGDEFSNAAQFLRDWLKNKTNR